MLGSPTVGAKVAVVGGGSTYTPELVEGLCDHEDRLVVDELVLLDPDADPARAGRRALRADPAPPRLGRPAPRTADPASGPSRGPTSSSSSCGSAGSRPATATRPCPSATAAWARRRPGRAGWPRRCGRCPWFSSWPSTRAARAAPGAWLVDFTNPVGIVTQALADEGHRALGLCNVARWVQRRAGHYLGVDPDDVELEHVGLNHLTWARSARVGRPDRLPELFDRFGPEIELESGSPIDLLKLLGALALLLPRTTTTSATPSWPPAGGGLPPAGRRGGRARRRAAGRVPGPRPGDQAREAFLAGGRLLLRGGRCG